ncbi:MAG: type II secretion system protein [Geobacteraceae bacterium]
MKKVLNNKGFALLAVLTMVIVMGISLGATGLSWRIVTKREREKELLFRGTQIRDAITRWYSLKSVEQAAMPLRDLKDLLKDPRTPKTVRYLRRLYIDPMTNKDWELIVDPAKGIQGVASTSQETPLKAAGFPEDLQDFADKKSYREWRFVYTPATPSAQPPGASSATPVLPSGTPQPAAAGQIPLPNTP